MLKAAIPVLHVADSIAAERFFCEELGFQRQFAFRLDEQAPNPCYMGVFRDDAELHLSSFSGDGVSGGVVYVLMDDVDVLHAELLPKKVTITLPPTDQTWGNREMYVRDPDGNSIRFTQPR